MLGISLSELQETPKRPCFGVSLFAAETENARKVVGCRVGDVKTATGIRSTIGGGQHIINIVRSNHDGSRSRRQLSPLVRD